MALNARKIQYKNTDRVKQPVLEPGGYPGRLVQVIDFGIQSQRPYQGQDKPPVQEIGLTYELSDEFLVDEEGNAIEDKPRWVSETIPLYSLDADKAKSTQRYYALDPQEDHKGDFTQLLGLPCLINIVNNKNNSTGVVYNNVGSINSLRPKDAAKLPELINEPTMFLLDEPDMEVFNKFPDFIKDKLRNNLEFKGSKLESLLKGGSGESEKDKEESSGPEVDPGNDDDTPW